MNTLNAFGHFVNFCNNNVGRFGITQEKYNKYVPILMGTPDYKFADCRNAYDVMSVIGFELENE